MMRIATDKSLNGQSLMITPRSFVQEGFVDIDRDDYRDTPEDAYLKAVQERQLVVIKDKWLDDQGRQGLRNWPVWAHNERAMREWRCK